MDSHSILDKDRGEVVPPMGEPPPSESPQPDTARASEAAVPEVRFPVEGGGKSLAEMARRDLNATLQLLAERAQYITGATGAAIALRDSKEMVCRASAGTSAPEVGAQLQISSGLSGESVRTRQTLRCHDAQTDERVNRESCEALGIRSVVVMPLLRRDEVLGVFELFSDKANVFEARDITALERMGAMVHSALEHSASGFSSPTAGAQRACPVDGAKNQSGEDLAGDIDLGAHQAKAGDDGPIPEIADATAAAPIDRPAVPVESNAAQGIAFHTRIPPGAAVAAASAMEKSVAASRAPRDTLAANDEPDILEVPAEPEMANSSNHEADELPLGDVLTEERDSIAPAAQVATPHPAVDIAAPEPPAPQAPKSGEPGLVSRGAIANLRKCEACGFPVSEGRQLCLDCEKKKGHGATSAVTPIAVNASETNTTTAAPATSTPTTISEEMPRFLAGESEEASWLATHKFLLVTIALAILAIVGAFLLR